VVHVLFKTKHRLQMDNVGKCNAELTRSLRI